MTKRDAQRHEVIPESPTALLARYSFALVATAAAFLVTLSLFESEITRQPIYAPLICAVALAAWFGGFGPAAVAVVLGWGLALVLLVSPNGNVLFDNTEDVTRWWVNLLAAVFIASAGSLLRLRQERASRELVTAQASVGEIESLQQLSVALSASLSSADVGAVLGSHAHGIVGSQGVALGLVDADRIVVAEATGIAGGALRGRQLDLEEHSMLAAAARGNAIARAVQRQTLDAAFPATARVVTPAVRSAFAVPIRSGEGTILGALEFFFDDEGGPTTESEGLARVIADLAGQALERARLYELERESRTALDRILQVAPRFLVDDTGSVVESVCREARGTFGADYAVLWRVVDSGLELICVDPSQEHAPDGLTLELGDFPQLRAAIEGLRTSFVPDVRESSTGAGYEFVQALGIRSSLRTPVVIGGRAELVLSISWQIVVSEPDPATIAVVRRFADQAGLALEQLERRRAQAEAQARADDTRRLQEVTAALSNAATPVDVSSTCLSHALESIGAEAGFVVLVGPDGSRTVELVATSGYEDAELAAWRAFGLDDDLPFSRAIGTGEPVWALEPAELAAFTAYTEPRTTGWFAIPLLTSRGARGALHVSLRDGRTVSESQRRWLQSMVTQCGQALERSGLYDVEQQSRLRAERLQAITAELSNALTSTDVAEVVVAAVVTAFEPESAALAQIAAGQPSGVLGAHGGGEDILAPLLDCGQGTPGALAVQSRQSVLIADAGTLGSRFPRVADALAAIGHETLLVVPLVAARRVNALLVVTWAKSDALSADDRGVIEALAGQAALALDRAGRYESEQAIAETLQRSVLPESLPRVDGVQLAARYLPGSTELDVGGDWFDAFSLPDGKLALVVGDVVGKGVEAAASMAQLRNAIRAFSVEPLKPSSTLARLNRLSAGVLDTSFATLVYVTADPATGVCQLASAGHPPIAVAYPDGHVELIETGRGLPLGTGLQAKYRQERLELPAGSVLVLYTDGLIERRGASIDDGLAALQTALAGAPTDPDRLLDHLLEQVIGGRDREDDIALLAVRFLPVAPRALDLRVPSDVDSMSLVRDALRIWLSGTPLERSEAEGVVLATWEALANAVEHAVDPSEGTVRVRAAVEDSRVRVTVDDTGAWRPESSDDDRGFGLKLIEALVSSMEIVPGDAGTRMTLEKVIPSGGRGNGRETS